MVTDIFRFLIYIAAILLFARNVSVHPTFLALVMFSLSLFIRFHTCLLSPLRSVFTDVTFYLFQTSEDAWRALCSWTWLSLWGRLGFCPADSVFDLGRLPLLFHTWLVLWKSHVSAGKTFPSLSDGHFHEYEYRRGCFRLRWELQLLLPLQSSARPLSSPFSSPVPQLLATHSSARELRLTINKMDVRSIVLFLQRKWLAFVPYNRFTLNLIFPLLILKLLGFTFVPDLQTPPPHLFFFSCLWNPDC